MRRNHVEPRAARRGAYAVHALFAVTLIATACPTLATTVGAAEENVVEISIKDHKFEPAEIKIPADQAIKIAVKNLDPTAEEVESGDLGFEKIIAGNSDAIIRLKPQKPGTYLFYGEYHTDTALGHFVVE